METLTEVRTLREPFRTGSRASTPQEKAEFRELLDSLGVRGLRTDRRESQSVSCFRLWAHEHGDRNPSLSVNLDKCVFHCFGCGTEGGLIQLREAAGLRGKHGRIAPVVEQLARLGGLTANPLELVPTEAVEALRRRTNRHKQDGRLNANLRTLLAIVAQRMIDEGHTRNVRLTAIDSRLGGLRGETCFDLLPLLRYFGLDVAVGESGRKVDPAKVAALKATLVSLTTESLSEYSCHYLRRVDEGSPLPCSITGEYSDTEGTLDHRLTIQVAQAVNATPNNDDEGASLWRRPAVARIVGLFANLHGEIPATGGMRGKRSALTTGEMRSLLGNVPWRTIHRAEALGLLSIMRVPIEAGDELSVEERRRTHAVIALTDEGRAVWERDVELGISVLCAHVAKQLTVYDDYKDRRRTAAKQYAEQVAQRAVDDFLKGERL